MHVDAPRTARQSVTTAPNSRSIMNILDLMNGNRAAVQQLASQFGLQPAQAEAAMSALLPMVTAGLQREAATSDAEAGLAAALATGQHESYIDQPAVLADPATTLDGNAILGHTFGTKEVSRQVAAGAAKKTGLDPATLQKMLPVVAAIVMGILAKQSKNAGAGAGAGGGAGRAPGSNGGLGGILGSLLDRNRNGSVVDDLAGMMGGALGRRA